MLPIMKPDACGGYPMLDLGKSQSGEYQPITECMAVSMDVRAVPRFRFRPLLARGAKPKESQVKNLIVRGMKRLEKEVAEKD